MATIRTITPDGEDAELFWATVGGNGLTGIVLRATIAMTPTETAYFIADGVATKSLDETVAVHLDGSEANYTYSAAWFDLISPPPKLGRAAISRGSLAKLDQLPKKLAKNPLKFDAPQLLTVPNMFPISAMNKLSFMAIGEMYYRLGGTYTGKIQNLSQFYHMLDLVSDWNNVYGPTGFAQHQFLVPPDAMDEFKAIIRWIQTRGHYSALNVFKLFGPGNRGTAEFPDGRLERCDGLPQQAWGQRVPQRTRPSSTGIRRARLHRQGLSRERRDFSRHVSAHRRVDRGAPQGRSHRGCSPPTWPDVWSCSKWCSTP